MPSYRTGVVEAILAERAGLQRVVVDGERAYVLTQLVGTVDVGDRVVVNTTAVELGLGTGGWHVVHWNLAREGWHEPGPGHVMKLRYSSLQVDAGAVEEIDAAALSEADDLGGLPVVACALHSQLACVAAAFRQARPEGRIAYVMTDSAALPLAVSDLVADLRGAGLIDLTVTAGQAFGGDLEAVSLASALVAARVVGGADLVIAGAGPGIVGTGTRLGYTGVEVGMIVDLADLLGGRAIAAVRFSLADDRPRHRGVSHHSITALGRLCRAGAVIGVPAGPYGSRVRDDLVAAGLDRRHRLVDVADVGVPRLLAERGLEVRSMGRGPDEDPGFYAVAGAAGTVAAQS